VKEKCSLYCLINITNPKSLHVFISSIKISSRVRSACSRLMYRERSMSLAHPRFFQKSSLRVISLTALCGEESLLHRILLSVPSEWIPMIRWVYANVYKASGTMRPRNTAYPDWRNIIEPTKNGAETPESHYRSRNEFSLYVAQSVLVGLRGLSDLTLISVVTIRIFYGKQPYNFQKLWNNVLNNIDCMW